RAHTVQVLGQQLDLALLQAALMRDLGEAHGQIVDRAREPQGQLGIDGADDHRGVAAEGDVVAADAAEIDRALHVVDADRPAATLVHRPPPPRAWFAPTWAPAPKAVPAPTLPKLNEPELLAMETEL